MNDKFEIKIERNKGNISSFIISKQIKPNYYKPIIVISEQTNIIYIGVCISESQKECIGIIKQNGGQFDSTNILFWESYITTKENYSNLLKDLKIFVDKQNKNVVKDKHNLMDYF